MRTEFAPIDRVVLDKTPFAVAAGVLQHGSA